MSEESQAVTLLSPEDIEQIGGIPLPAVVGLIATESDLDSEEISPDGFTPNPDFVAVLHEVVASHGADLDEIQAQAKEVGDGWAYVIDERREDLGDEVPAEDVVGAFEVKKGKVDKSSYQANENYLLVSEAGLLCLPEELEEKLLETLRQMPPFEEEELEE